MLDVFLGIGIGWGVSAGISRISKTWLRRIVYIVVWFILYVVLLAIGSILAREAGVNPTGDMVPWLANSFTIGLVISAWYSQPKSNGARLSDSDGKPPRD